MQMQDWIHQYRHSIESGMHRYGGRGVIVTDVQASRCFFSFSHWTDSCQVKNGGCDANAACSHDPSNNQVLCTCKTGYTNTGSASNVNCTGRTMHNSRHQSSNSSVFTQILASSTTVAVIAMPTAHTMPQPMLSNAHARLAMSSMAVDRVPCAQVM